MVVCVFFFLALPLGVERKGSPPTSPASSSTTTVGTSEEEGLHARPLPRILEVAFYVVSGDFGRGRIGTLLFTLPACTSEEEGQALFLTLSARSKSTCLAEQISAFGVNQGEVVKYSILARRGEEGTGRAPRKGQAATARKTSGTRGC